jgi:hypothetical protein
MATQEIAPNARFREPWRARAHLAGRAVRRAYWEPLARLLTGTGALAAFSAQSRKLSDHRRTRVGRPGGEKGSIACCGA